MKISWTMARACGKVSPASGRRGWKKLHLGVDRSGVTRAQAITESTVDDATAGSYLVEHVDGEVASVTADAAYDTIALYTAAGARGATVVVPPARTASVSRRGPRSSVRDRTIKRVRDLGRRRWKNESGYHQQARVENAFFRYKSIIGDSVRARTPGGRLTEALLACNVLNRMTELGRPVSYSIGQWDAPGLDCFASASSLAPTPLATVVSQNDLETVSVGSAVALSQVRRSTARQRASCLC